MKKQYLLIAMLFAMAMMLSQRMNAQTVPVWDGAYAPWTQGSGTQADPYLIEIPQHLAWLAQKVNDGTSTYNGVYFRLTSDLDMNSLEWTPIGNSSTNCFRGVFDGNGHLIDNVYILSHKENGTEVNSTYAGMFGVIYNALIMNLSVRTTITATDQTLPSYAGGIVAYSKGDNNVLTNCHHFGNIIFGNINGYYCPKSLGISGGIIGYVNGVTALYNCQNNGKIQDYHLNNSGLGAFSACNLGGLIGEAHATVTISDCSNNAVVNGAGGNDLHQAGGLIGNCSNCTITIINSHNEGNISAGDCGGLVCISSSCILNINNSYNTGTLVGNHTKGGLIGYSYSNSNISITYSYNIGALSNGKCLGGLVGFLNGDISVLHSYNSGSLLTNNSGKDAYGGGIIGKCDGTATISCSTNSGNVLVTTGSSSSSVHAYSGGIVGYANNTFAIDRCCNTANIAGLETNTSSYTTYGYVGGLVGYVNGYFCNIHECYNTGAINTATCCGGILGYNNGGISITNCYNVGLLSGGNPKGIADYNSSYTPTITNCYYLNTCGGSAQTGAISKTSSQMQSPYFPGMLNVGVQAYVQDVSPYVNQGYPIFGDMVYAVSTQAATNVGVTKAMLHGTYAGGADVAAFQYRENITGSDWTTVNANIGSPVAYLLTGLQSNTTYIYRFMVQKNGGSYYGEEMTFTTGTCNLTANVTPSSVNICEGASTTLTASAQSSLGNYFTYNWNTGATTANLNVSNGGLYTVTVSDTNGCSASASANVVAHPQPVVSISGDTYLCMGQSSLLTASGGNTYAWSTGASTPSVTVNHGGTYTVTATNSYGCSSSTSITITSLENLSISGNTSFCNGQGTTLSVANGTGSYLWSTGATASSIPVSQAGLYTVTVTLPNGCSSSVSAYVNVAPTPTPTILGSTTICQGQTTTLTANGGNSYAWSNGSTSSNVTVSQSGVYTVTATNAEGCSASTNVTVTVNPLPNVNISGNSNFCQGDNTTLTATGASTYTWSNSQSGNAVTVNNAGTYTVTGTDANGCSNSATKTVSVYPTYNIPLTHSICQGESYNFHGQNLTTAGTYTHTLQTVNGCDSVLTLTLTVEPLPTPTISGNTSLCQGQTTTLTANGGNSYAWSNGSTSNSISVSQSGSYTVTITNVEGCSACTNVTVTVNPLPNVNISGNSNFCQGDNTTLTATGANTYAWSNSQSGNAITVSNVGTYTVSGTDANGCTNTATKTVSLNPTYNIPLTHSICQGESYNFHGQNLTTSGTYTHTLQTINGCDSVLTLTLTVKPLPTPTISGNTSLCQGQTTTLTANGGNSYLWSNGNTSNSISVSQSGSYTVTITNVEGCSACTNVTVTVNPLPNVNISGNSNFCQGDNTTLTATGASTYTWSNSQSSNAITVSNAGSYTVTGTDANGCTSTATKTVSVNPTYNIPLTHSICQGESYNFYGQNITAAGTYTHTLQTVNGCDSVLTLVVTLEALPTMTITGNTTLCEGESATLTANGGVSYAWSNGNTSNSINVAQSGVYTVTATNVQGCTATATATVTVNPLPIVVIGGNTTICEGGSTTLTASGADTYNWSTGDNTASVNINAFGIYTVTGTSSAGCSSTANVTVLVSQLPIITITGETDICAGESTTLTANGGATYLWSNGTTDATLTVSNAGTYQVIGYNEAGCNAMASATVNVWQPASSEFSVECSDSCYTWNAQTYCASGDYTQTLQTVHGCDSIVTLHLTITVGIDDYDDFDFKVYPNPTNSVVNVQCTMNNVQFGDMELQLVDAYGRLLDVVRANNDSPLQTAQIDLSRYAAGVYFLKAVADGETIAVRKVVKQ